MGLAEQLWQANQDLAIACLDHPFVRGIGDGSLSRQKFANYVGQDAFFLEAFARAYSIAAAKAPDWESFGVFHTLANGVLQELELHGSYAANWGVSLANVEPGSATRHYTDFLIATAWSQEVGMITVAMLPCMRLYAYLGQMLAQPRIPSHQYADWIRTYSGTEFAPLVKQLAELADRYATNNPQIQATYRYAMQCELNFFQAAWVSKD
ncbi:TenA family protein [Microcoleus sp. FACHB-1515]|uniref:TenA family protein n=1 Tax=Cyanophyceae TaxID=3028117 RepID=UPI001688E71C|nr:TenA family protein [Microcoleus sp. FACHB-1515]MBD2089628.1 TenA family protein [Microcoleus sp. FACHB-1515]